MMRIGELRSYGRFGELVEARTTLFNNVEPSRGSWVFSSRYAYDSLGRMRQMTYPDGEVVTYGYDAGGNVKSARGVRPANPDLPQKKLETEYLKHIGYDEFEQRVVVEYGNGIKTRYAYQPAMRRLDKVDTDHLDRVGRELGEGARPFQRLRFGYDEIGNVTALRNEVPLTARMTGGVRIGPAAQTFGYDDLDQLTSSTGTYDYETTKRSRYDLAVEYDEIGNILRKDQQHVEQSPEGASWKKL
jgi:uncharacterized protein RhaS with RHS repeats